MVPSTLTHMISGMRNNLERTDSMEEGLFRSQENSTLLYRGLKLPQNLVTSAGPGTNGVDGESLCTQPLASLLNC